MACLATAGLSQTNQTAPVPVANVAAPNGGMDSKAIQERIQTLEKSVEGDAAARSKLIETYRQALQRMDAAKTHAEKAEAYRKSIEIAPPEIARIRSLIAALGPNSVSNLLADLPMDITVEQAESRLGQEQAALQSLKTELADLLKQIETEEARPAAARAQATEAGAMMDKIKAELAAAPPAADSAESDRASRLLLENRLNFRTAEIRSLEQELVSNPIRLDLLTATRDLTVRQIAKGEAAVKAMETKVSELRAAETERARIEAQKIKREAIGKHRLLRKEADAITAINKETQGLSPLIDGARRQREATDLQLEQIQSDLEEARRSLELGEISDELATVLLEQRQSLQSERDLEKTAAEISAAKSKARLRLFKVDREIRQLGDLNLAAEQLLSEAGDLPAAEADQETLAGELRKILDAKRGHLQKHAQALRAYTKELHQRESEQSKFAAQTTLMAETLDENLLWIRNAPALGWKTFTELAEQSLRLAQDPGWAAAAGDMRIDAGINLPLYLGCLIVFAALVAFRGRMAALLERQSAHIGKVGADNMVYSAKALALTFCIAAPGALALIFLGWRMSQSDAEFSKAAGTAAQVSGAAYFVVRFVKAICRPHGLGSHHFDWNGANLQKIRTHVTWFIPFATVCGFLLALTESLGDPLYRNSIGRLAFIILMAAAAGLAFMVFHPRQGLEFASTRTTQGWASRKRFFWQIGTILPPFILAALAAAGYSYMAVAFEYRLNQTVILLLLATGGYAFSLRWLAISQRRLAFKIAMDKRQALLRSREDADDPETDIDPFELLPEIDVLEVREQSIELLRMSVALAVIVGLWFSWSDVLPAFRVLDKVELWNHTVVIEGQETFKAITLANLGLSVLIFVVTVVAARNLPGFLEIAILQRLPVDQGSRYATRTLTLYAIVSIGIALAFNAIGIGWSSVQWLVAALTVGLGFGLQEIFGNFVSGLIILLERPIRVGDTVTVGSISGVVTEIRMRATTILDWNRKELVVPNKSFITGELINWSLSDPILRMDFSVGVAYGSDTTLAHQTMLEVCRSHPMVLDQPEPTVFFNNFGDNSLNFDVRVFVRETNNTARTRITHDLHMAIDEAFRKHDICIAFPQRDVHLDTLTPLEVRVLPLENPGDAPKSKKASKDD